MGTETYLQILDIGQFKHIQSLIDEGFRTLGSYRRIFLVKTKLGREVDRLPNSKLRLLLVELQLVA